MSAIVNRRIKVHIMPRINFKFPSMISNVEHLYQGLKEVCWVNTPSDPMLVNLIPRPVMYSRALFTFSAFWMRSRGFLLYLPRDTSPVRSGSGCQKLFRIGAEKSNMPIISCIGKYSEIRILCMICQNSPLVGSVSPHPRDHVLVKSLADSY